MSSTDKLQTIKSSASQSKISVHSKVLGSMQSSGDTPIIKPMKVEVTKPIEAKGVNPEEEEVKQVTSLTQSAESAKDNEEQKQSVSEIFKARLATFKRQISKNMTFSDQMDMRDV